MRRKQDHSSQSFVLIDLDGTLVDPAPGIIGSVQHALREIGAETPPAEELGWVIGPPLRETFAKLLTESADVEAAVTLYREVYGNGALFKATPYNGIFEALGALQSRGYTLFLCTAKPVPFARRVIDHFGFSEYFTALYGAELDGTFDDKGELIAHILASHSLSASSGCMVGDRANDTLAARRNGMRSIGVTWGYGSHEELRENGVTILCEQVSELPGSIEAILKVGLAKNPNPVL
ncbi:MAG: HAD hydrolase-like protein [Pseudomonadota bacterium]